MTFWEKIEYLRIHSGISKELFIQYLELSEEEISSLAEHPYDFALDILEKSLCLFKMETDKFLQAESVDELNQYLLPAGITYDCDALTAIAAVNRIALNLEFMHKLTHDESVIPKGAYCYTFVDMLPTGGYKIKLCPYYRRFSEDVVGCNFTNYVGYDPCLNDQCKMCGVNDDFGEDEAP